MKKPIVYKLLTHTGARYYRCLKGNGSGGCKEKVEITKDVFIHLKKYDNAHDKTPNYI